jgi:hypothetical protein
VALHRLSELTTHEGLPGRWYPEHDLDPGQSGEELERLKWASWENKRSFWPTRGGLLHAMRRAGFSIVVEDFDKVAGDEVRALSPEGWTYLHNRSMFVGIKTAGAQEAAEFDAPAHALNGSLGREAAAPAPVRAAPDDPLAALRADAANLRAEIAALRGSTSWKLTAPVRALRRLLPGG